MLFFLGRSRGYCIWSCCFECSRTDSFIQCFLWQISQGNLKRYSYFDGVFSRLVCSSCRFDVLVDERIKNELMIFVANVFVKFSRSVTSENFLIQVVIFIRILFIFRLPGTIQTLCLWTNQVQVDNPACFNNTATLDLGNKHTVKDTDGDDCLIGRYVTRVSYALWLECSFPGMEFGELHLCPDSTPPSRERGRSGCHKRKNLFWSCGQYSKGKLLTSVSLNCNSVLRDQFSTENKIIPPVMYFSAMWCLCLCANMVLEVLFKERIHTAWYFFFSAWSKAFVIHTDLKFFLCLP